VLLIRRLATPLFRFLAYASARRTQIVGEAYNYHETVVTASFNGHNSIFTYVSHTPIFLPLLLLIQVVLTLFLRFQLMSSL
jgi:hypothetical protein